MPRKYLWMTRRRTCDRPRPEEEEILQTQRLSFEPLFFYEKAVPQRRHG